jgi:hypothetical protein
MSPEVRSTHPLPRTCRQRHRRRNS